MPIVTSHLRAGSRNSRRPIWFLPHGRGGHQPDPSNSWTSREQTRRLSRPDRPAVRSPATGWRNAAYPAAAMESVKRLARESNEYGAKMVSDYPKRFGLFASLPMPD